MKKGPKQRGPSLSSRTKSSLHDWEEKYRLMVENVNDGVYLLNTDGRYIFVNRALEQRGIVSGQGINSNGRFKEKPCPCSSWSA
jgi:hypothetical protein